MREILFRGKGTGGFYRGRFVYGDLAKDFWRQGDCGILPIDKDQGGYIEVDPETVGQYTGLADKNGNKIFEGDIVHCVSQRDMAKMVVIFEQGEFRMVLAERYNGYIEGCGFYAIRCFTKEVIGNIHDNHELLKGE